MISGNGMMTDDDFKPPDYAYKPSLIGAPMEFRLGPDAFEWSRGGSTGEAPYGRIRRIRLSFRPMTMQHYRFLAEVWPQDGAKVQIASTSCKSMFEFERQDQSYAAFVAELSRRIGAAGRPVVFQTGSPAFLYWPGVAIFLAALFSMIGLAVRAMQTDAFGGAAFILGFALLFLWQGGGFFLRNKPGTFDPNAIPPVLLPGGSLIDALRRPAA